MLERFREYTLIRVVLHTGRTHQIRVHMAHIGYPLAGDPLYGGNTDVLNRQALHSTRIVFKHPITGEQIDISAPLPEDLRHSAHHPALPDHFLLPDSVDLDQ